MSQVQSVNGPPPKSWEDYRRGCVSTFRGGREGQEATAFIHGMHTVFDLLEEEFPAAETCKAADCLLEACKKTKRVLAEFLADEERGWTSYGDWFEALDLATEAIAKTKGE